MKFFYFCISVLAVSICSAQQQGAPTAGIVTQTRSATTSAGTTGTTVTPATGAGVEPNTSTAVPAGTTGSLVGATNVTADLPVLQNTTNLFGQITGVVTNQAAILSNQLNATRQLVGSGAAGGVTAAQQASLGVTAPGFTQITITLQGIVQSESDRQAILNRFQGIPGFVVVDQMQLPGASVNEAAGAEAPTRVETTTEGTQP